MRELSRPALISGLAAGCAGSLAWPPGSGFTGAKQVQIEQRPGVGPLVINYTSEVMQLCDLGPGILPILAKPCFRSRHPPRSRRASAPAALARATSKAPSGTRSTASGRRRNSRSVQVSNTVSAIFARGGHPRSHSACPRITPTDLQADVQQVQIEEVVLGGDGGEDAQLHQLTAGHQRDGEPDCQPTAGRYVAARELRGEQRGE